MPELPEVQIQVNQLRRLRGARIRRVESRDSKIRLPRSLTGRSIRNVRRRAKFIIFDLSDGRHLLVHLRMTGWFEFTRPSRFRLALHTTSGSAYFVDSRRFGTVEALKNGALKRKLAGLGPEPLNRGFILDRLRQTGRPVKVALLDQALVAGVGNIYASEALWRARIHPDRSASRLSATELGRLRRGIRSALRKGIAYGPRIFEVQEFYVYDRAGRCCRRCRTAIRRMMLAGRSTYFCPVCQPPG
jgi:formamidopyrimidine-DNA glycosylase